MPLYTWYDKKENKEFEVYRQKFDDSGVAPTDDDLPEDEKGKERDWEKRIGKGIRTVKGSNWGMGKGNWGK